MRQFTVIAVVLVLVGFGAWKYHAFFAGPPLHQSVNSPGQAVSLRQVASPGKTTVVHYYADWCPACSKWKETMKSVEAQFTDIRVVYVDIGSFNSEVAQQHRIQFVPNFKIFDRRGLLIAEDKAADAWLRMEIDRRLAARRMTATAAAQ